MPSTVFLDTNILLYDPDAIFHFGEQDVVIPIEVLEEVEDVKHDPSETGRNSRRTAVLMDELRTRGSLGKGVQLDKGGTLRVLCDSPGSRGDLPAVCRGGGAVPSILRAALRMIRENESAAPLIVTKNVNLRLKADALGIAASDYDVDCAPGIEEYLGWHEVEADPALVAHLREGLSIRLPDLDVHPNEYVFVRDRRDAKSARIGRVAANGLDVVPLLDSCRTICGIRGLNVQQTYTIDALLAEDVPLVTLAGKAGTGKTLLAMAAGLRQVFADDRYQGVVVFRPTIA
ncbi:MAG: PhoH family protein, partial [Lentisphaeria bacterium]|nr:PhoH family protein [Lentisphaeria bacterium]